MHRPFQGLRTVFVPHMAEKFWSWVPGWSLSSQAQREQWWGKEREGSELKAGALNDNFNGRQMEETGPLADKRGQYYFKIRNYICLSFLKNHHKVPLTLTRLESSVAYCTFILCSDDYHPISWSIHCGKLKLRAHSAIFSSFPPHNSTFDLSVTVCGVLPKCELPPFFWHLLTGLFHLS